jgi:hypothetical protein
LQHILKPLATKLELKLTLLVQIEVARPPVYGCKQPPHNWYRNDEPGDNEVSDAFPGRR